MFVIPPQIFSIFSAWKEWQPWHSFSLSSEVFNLGARIFLSVAFSQIVSFQLYASILALVFSISCSVFSTSAWFSTCSFCSIYWASASSAAIFSLSCTSFSLEGLELLEPFDFCSSSCYFWRSDLKSWSSIALLFLCNWAVIFSLLSFKVLILNDFPFCDIVMDLLSDI